MQEETQNKCNLYCNTTPRMLLHAAVRPRGAYHDPWAQCLCGIYSGLHGLHYGACLEPSWYCGFAAYESRSGSHPGSARVAQRHPEPWAELPNFTGPKAHWALEGMNS